MPPREPPPLLGTSHFRILIGRREVGFAEVGPLSSHSDPALPEGERVHALQPVVLRRALTASMELYEWRQRIVGGKKDRRAVTIHQLDAADGTIVNSWRLEDAWPCRWSGPSFAASGSAIATEEIELAYRDLVWIPKEGA